MNTCKDALRRDCMGMVASRVVLVFVGKVSEGTRSSDAVADQQKMGHLVPLRNSVTRTCPRPPANTLVDSIERSEYSC